MYNLLRPLLFRLEPETAHQLTLQAVRFAGKFPPTCRILEKAYQAPDRPVSAFGLAFKNPIGLAAGYDKDAVALRGLAAMGFGHVEVGTVTPLPQPGNPHPRIFRLVEDEAVINRMGFPGKGSAYVVRSLAGRKRSWLLRSLDRLTSKKSQPENPNRPNQVILGVNIGRNKSTPNEEAVLDYLSLLQIFAPYADYLAINISSPNTVGLRQLQGREALEGLLTQLDIQRRMEEKKLEKRLPLLVKLAPDLSEQELDDAAEVILATNMDGIIATNTTLAREGLKSKYQGETGGLSGSPLRVRSEAVLAHLVKAVGEKIPIVSVGGIMGPEDARRRLDLGATLIQLYTGLVYQGPALVKKILVE